MGQELGQEEKRPPGKLPMPAYVIVMPEVVFNCGLNQELFEARTVPAPRMVHPQKSSSKAS